jgi:AcrR family transcriptional regulator
MHETNPRYLPTDERKRAIAAAARSLIVEKGFEGLRTRDIAARVGINIATLHYHVPTKEALIELVALSLAQDFAEQHMRRFRPGQAPLQQLRLQIEEFRETRDQTPEMLGVMEELGRRARHDDNIARHMRPLRMRWFGHFVEIFKEGVADGTFRPDLDPPAAAMMAIGALIVSSEQNESGIDPLDLVEAELIRSFLSPSKKDFSNG